MTQPKSPQAVLFQFINAYWVTFPIIAAAELGISDLLADGPQTAEALAGRTNTHAPSLYRLLRALSSVGIFAEEEDGRFRQTPLSEALRSGIPDSMRGLARLTGRVHLQAWPELMHCLRTGETAMTKVFGCELLDYVKREPELGLIFDDAFTDYTETVSRTVAGAYDFTGFKSIVDVGGGRGTLVAAIIERVPGARAICFDLPPMADQARAYLESCGLADRCKAIGGDYLESIPAGGDAYILKMILHTWDDERAVSILKNVRRAISSGGRLLVMDDAVLPPASVPSMGKLIDINMLVTTGGRKRSEKEYAALFRAANFELERVLAVHPSCTVLEGSPASD